MAVIHTRKMHGNKLKLNKNLEKKLWKIIQKKVRKEWEISLLSKYLMERNEKVLRNDMRKHI